jgi:hypothetical protein
MPPLLSRPVHSAILATLWYDSATSGGIDDLLGRSDNTVRFARAPCIRLSGNVRMSPLCTLATFGTYTAALGLARGAIAFGGMAFAGATAGSVDSCGDNY